MTATKNFVKITKSEEDFPYTTLTIDISVDLSQKEHSVSPDSIKLCILALESLLERTNLLSQQ